MTATLTRLTPPQAKRAAKPRAVQAKPSRQSILQRRMGYAFGGLATSLTCLSLSHLAEGVTLVAHRAAWEGWSVAVAIDCGFIACEAMPFLVGAECARDTRLARHGLSACVLAASAAFNGMAFATDAPAGVMRFAAIALGLAVPLAVATFAHLAGRCLIGRAR